MVLILLHLFFLVPLGLAILLPGRKTLGVYFVLCLMFGILVMFLPGEGTFDGLGKFILMLSVLAGCGGTTIKGAILAAVHKPKTSKFIYGGAILFTLIPTFMSILLIGSINLKNRLPSHKQNQQLFTTKMGDTTLKIPVRGQIVVSVHHPNRRNYSYKFDKRIRVSEFIKTEVEGKKSIELDYIQIYLPKKLRERSNGRKPKFLSNTQKWCELHDQSFVTIWCDSMAWSGNFRLPKNFEYGPKPDDQTFQETIRSKKPYLLKRMKIHDISDETLDYFRNTNNYYKAYKDSHPYLYCADKTKSGRKDCALFFLVKDDIWGKVEFSEKTDKFEKAMRWGFTRGQSLIKELQP